MTVGIMALALHAGINGALPIIGAQQSSPAAEKAIERIGDELASIRSSLVQTQIETSRAIAVAMQELSNHSRRLENLENYRKR